MVVGEGEKMPTALIQPNFDFLKEWASRNDMNISEQKDLVANEKVIARIQEELDECNCHFGKWEQIKRFELTADQWTIDGGHLTPTMKMKRKIIKEIYTDLYEKMYDRA